MPICGRCQIGFDEGDSCPKCGSLDGDRKPALVNRFRVGDLLCFALAVALHSVVSLVAAGIAISFGVAFAWGSSPGWVGTILAVVATVIVVVFWAPAILLRLLGATFVPPGIILSLINSTLWLLAAMAILRWGPGFREWAKKKLRPRCDQGVG